MCLSRFHLDQMLLVDINKFLAELVDFIEIGWFPSKHLAFKYSPYFFLIEPYSLVFVKAILNV